MYKNNKLMKEVSEELLNDFLSDIPTDEELKDIELPEGYYERGLRGLNVENKPRRPKIKAYWVAAIIAAILVVGSINAGALNLGFIIDTINKMAGNNEIRSVDKKVLSPNELQSLYSALYKSKNDIKFTPLVFAYIPEEIEYKTFNVNLDGRVLEIFYEKGDVKVQFKQRYTDSQNTLGASLDNTNTEQKKIKINKKDTTLYVIKQNDNDNYAVRWSDEDYCYYTVSSQGLPLDVLLDMIKSLTAL